MARLTALVFFTRKALENRNKYSETGESLVIEQIIKEKHFAFQVVPVRDVGYVNVYGDDVTFLKKTQEELKRHKDHLEELVAERTEEMIRAFEELKKKRESLAEAQRIGRMGNWDLNIPTNGLAWSDEIYRIFGLKPQEFGATYDAFLKSVHPDDRDFVKYSVNEALDKGKPYSIDHRIVLPDGVERVVHEQAEVFRDKDGKAVRMMGTVQDITERKRAEGILNRLIRMFQMLNDCIESVAHANNEDDLLSKICEILVVTGGYRMAWVGYAERDARKSVRPVAQHGFEEGYLETAGITWADNERGSGPTGRAIRTGISQMARNILKDQKFAPWREAAIERG